MASWAELHNNLNAQPEDKKGAWLVDQAQAQVQAVSRLTGKNVLLYASSFLQKPEVPGLYAQINREDINGFMTGLYGMDWDRGLTLILHTPGGMAEAAETIVEYLWSKFDLIEVIVPTYAMSAGTMISLACNEVIMGRQSQLGPIDPQLNIGGRVFSAHSIVNQFEEAKAEIASNIGLAHAWAPVLQHYGPALLQEARKALGYGEEMVARWLATRMFKGDKNAERRAKETAKYFNDVTHKSHGKRINRDEARGQGVTVQDLEDNQDLQEAVLTLYHVVTLAFENSPATKCVFSSSGKTWLKNVQIQVQRAQ